MNPEQQAQYVKRLISETESFALRVYEIIKPDPLPEEGTNGTRWITPEAGGNFDALAGSIHTALDADARIRALVFAYAFRWYRPGRRHPGTPTDPEFLMYREAVRERLLQLLEAAPTLEAVLRGLQGGKAMIPADEPEVLSRKLIDRADKLRSDYEQDGDGAKFTQPLLDAADPVDQKRIQLAALKLMLERYQQ